MAIKKILSAISLSALVVIFIVQAMIGTVLFFMPAPAQAASDYSINLEVPIPTLHGGSANIKFNGSTAPIADYVRAIYTFAVGAVGIVAAVVLMIGGLMWITAGGNASNVSEAKSMITASLTGLVLVLVSYLLLDQINPALVNLKAPGIQQPTAVVAQTATATSNCSWQTGTCADNFVKADSITLCTGETMDVRAVCCCIKGCPTDSAIPCQACPDCDTITGITGMSCKDPGTCKVVPSVLAKLTNAALNNHSGVNLMITEAWPPTVYHATVGHQNGNCVDLAPSNRTDDSGVINLIQSALTGAGFSQVLYECFPNDSSCSCSIYDFKNCGATETGAAAGGNNHFHVCN